MFGNLEYTRFSYSWFSGLYNLLKTLYILTILVMFTKLILYVYFLNYASSLFVGPIWCWLSYLPQLQLHMVINLYILSSWLLLFFCLLWMLWTFYSFLTDQRGFTGREWVLFLGRHKLKPAFYFSLDGQTTFVYTSFVACEIMFPNSILSHCKWWLFYYWYACHFAGLYM